MPYDDDIYLQVQGLVNTFGDLRGSLAATERINSILSDVEADEALAFGLEREIQPEMMHDKTLSLFEITGSEQKSQSLNLHYMSALKSVNNVSTLAWSGDVRLEGILFACLHSYRKLQLSQH